MTNIERKLQHGWDLDSFLREFGCNSEEELFEFLRKEFSRKTVNSYIVRMKKNSLKDDDKRIIQSKEASKPANFVEEEQIQIQVETTIEKHVEIETEQQVQKEGVLSRIIKFFKKFLK